MEVTQFSSSAEKNPIQIDVDSFIQKAYGDGYVGCQVDMLCDGIYKYMGWQYDFREYLTRYVVRQYGNWRDYYAPNKTILRKVLGSGITKIIEFK
jgi:hypothetical protein